MTNRMSYSGAFFFMACFFLSPAIFSQGTQDDYRRAAELRDRAREKVFRDRIEPQWIDTNHFWYRVTTGKQEHQFILVDASSGRRKLLFDHSRLAQALSDRLGSPVMAEALPLSNLRVEADLSKVEFTAHRRRWRCDLSSYVIEPANRDAVPAPALPPLRPVPTASRTTGAETEVLFVNASSETVRLFWRNPQGQRVPYATLPAGGEHRQHTFGGHVWEVTDLQTRSLVGFIASDVSSNATIGESPPEIERSPPTEESHRSPDGLWHIRFENHNVVLRAIQPAEEELTEYLLTQDGTPDDAYAGPVHWSPDSKQFVVLQTRTPQKRLVNTIESSPNDQLQPRLHTFEYAKPGDPIDHPRPRLFDVATRQNIPISETLFPSPWSIQDLTWDRDSKRFTFLYNQRGHQLLRVIAVDTRGAASTIIEETSPTFIDYHAKYFCERLEESNEILWMSERDGWNHLWLYDATTGKVKHQVTRGEWVVHEVIEVDRAQRQVWFMAGGVRPEQDPYYSHLCRVNFDGSGLTILTEGDGTHDVTFAPHQQWFIDTWSRVDQPPVIELRRTSDGQRVCILEQTDIQSLLATGWTIPERFVTPGRDGMTNIYGVIIRPSNFDPAKRYPIVEQIYAGPHDAHVPKAFQLLIGQHAMAELGFILVQIDGMGTNWRSKAFHDVCYRNLADAGFADRIAWIREAAKTRPWMDLDRIGIYGGSAGGQNAMRALIDHHDFYSVAVADCGCHDNRLDKIWWNELWMGFPLGPHYEMSSNAVQAHRLQGKLMLIVGELDRNVDPASTMQVVSALQKADKDFDLVVIAGAGHGAAETAYGSRRRSDFLVRHLLHVEPRSAPPPSANQNEADTR